MPLDRERLHQNLHVVTQTSMSHDRVFGETGDEENLQGGMKLPRGICKLAAIEAILQADVSDEQIDAHIGAQYSKRPAGVLLPRSIVSDVVHRPTDGPQPQHTFPITIVDPDIPSTDAKYADKALMAAACAHLVRDAELKSLTARIHVSRGGAMAPYGHEQGVLSQTTQHLDQTVRERAAGGRRIEDRAPEAGHPRRAIDGTSKGKNRSVLKGMAREHISRCRPTPAVLGIGEGAGSSRATSWSVPKSEPGGR